MRAGAPTAALARRPSGAVATGLCLLASVAVATAAVVGIGDAGGERSELRLLASAGGKMALTNSKQDEAILRAGHLVPGQTVRGRVDLGVDGGGGRLWLEPSAVTGSPGPNGGELRQVLQVRIERPWAIQAQNRRPLYHDTLAEMPRLNLGEVPAGVTRRYRISVRFPDSGPPPSPTGGDNAFQGSFAEVSFIWGAQQN